MCFTNFKYFPFYSEQIDLMRLALRYRDRLKQVLKENAHMASKNLQLSEVAELAKRKLAVVRSIMRVDPRYVVFVNRFGIALLSSS